MSGRIPIITMTVIAPGLLGTTLKAVRRRHGLTVRAAAKLASVTSSTFSRAERSRPTNVAALLALTAFVKIWARRRKTKESTDR